MQAGDETGQIPGPEDQNPARDQVGLDRARARLERLLGGRPLTVYGVLAAGVGVLLVLLLIIWITAGGGGSDDKAPPCFALDGATARDAVLNGEVERVDVTYALDQPEFGPALLRLDKIDGTCISLEQGAKGLEGAYQVIGAVAYYNEITEQQRVRLDYDAVDVPAAVLTIPTPTPTPMPPTEPILPASPTAAPTATATATPIPTEVPVLPIATRPPASPVAGSPISEPDVETPVPTP
ncbi:MAG: hypothetical protein M3R02_04790 [Chloroflexota bacterium]|nr:hypothetical protein [Chloroflexota bacterium]